MLRDIQDLSSQTMDESVESYPLNHQGIIKLLTLNFWSFFLHFLLISSIIHDLATKSCRRSLLWPHGLYPPGSSVHGIFQASVLEWIPFSLGIFQPQGLNLCLLHWQADSLPLSHQGSPYPFIFLMEGKVETEFHWGFCCYRSVPGRAVEKAARRKNL